MIKYMVEIECQNPDCKKKFKRYSREYNRMVAFGKKAYCSLSCCGYCEGYHIFDSLTEERRENLQDNIRDYVGVDRDGYTPFRFFIKVINNKNRSSKSVDIDLEYLKDIWQKQNGICPITGWKIILPQSAAGWRKEIRITIRASLDRIDNSKGYIKGNVRFVAIMANYARNNMEDKDLICFCKAVSNYNKNYVVGAV